MGLQKLYLVKSDDSNRNFRKRKDAKKSIRENERDWKIFLELRRKNNGWQ